MTIGNTYEYNYHSDSFEIIEPFTIYVDNDKRDNILDLVTYIDMEENSITFAVDSFHELARTYQIVIFEGVLIDNSGNSNKKIVYELTGREAQGDFTSRSTLREVNTLKINDSLDSSILLRIIEYAVEIVLQYYIAFFIYRL